MKRKPSLALLLLIVVFLGCKKNSIDIKSAPIELGEIKNHTVTTVQAEKMAILYSIYPTLPAKSKKQNQQNTNPLFLPLLGLRQGPEKSVKNTIEVREEQLNPTMYVINYKEGGFLILSGDDRMMPILAFSDKGSFDMTEISKLPGGVRHWMHANHKYIIDLRNGKQKEHKGNPVLWKDFQRRSEMTKGNYTTSENIPSCGPDNIGDIFNYYYANGPLLTTEWGQNEHFNELLPLIPTGIPFTSPCKPLVGCVGVSIAQIMNYHQFPNTYNWSAIYTPYGSPSLDRYILMLNCAEAVNTNYGCNGSSATTNATDNAFWSFGYSSAVVQSYNFEMAYNNIRFGYPVILAANEGLLQGGHQWVADGVMINQTFVCSEPSDFPEGPHNRGLPEPQYNWALSYSSEMLHMNWGWYGVYNAWFNAYVWSVGGSDYDYGMKMVRSIIP